MPEDLSVARAEVLVWSTAATDLIGSLATWSVTTDSSKLIPNSAWPVATNVSGVLASE